MCFGVTNSAGVVTAAVEGCFVKWHLVATFCSNRRVDWSFAVHPQVASTGSPLLTQP